MIVIIRKIVIDDIYYKKNEALNDRKGGRDDSDLKKTDILNNRQGGEERVRERDDSDHQ